MHLLGRVSDLTIYCPGNIEEIVDVHLKASESKLNYTIIYKKSNHLESELAFENKQLEVISIPLKHRIPCCGYLFREKPKPRRINPNAIELYKVPKYEINKIKVGKDFVNESGEIINNNKLTIDSLPSFSYAFLPAYLPVLQVIQSLMHLK